MGESRQLEQEVKLEAGPAWSLPDLAGVVPEAELRALPALSLVTTYYDTADLRLARRRIALRHRFERPTPPETAAPTGTSVAKLGQQRAGSPERRRRRAPAKQSSSVWTVKLAPLSEGAVLARTEVNWPDKAEPERRAAEKAASNGLPTSTRRSEAPAPSDAKEPTEPVRDGDRPAHPDAVRFLAAVTLGEPLQPVARLWSARRRTELRVAGRPAAEIDEDSVEGTVLAGQGGGTVAFKEVEVELAQGAPLEILEAVVSKLLASGAQQSARSSKFWTVLQSAPRSGLPVEEVSALLAGKASVTNKRASTMAEVLREQARSCLDVLVEHDPPIRLADPDPEHVHKARVATRRFRSVLRALQHLRPAEGSPATGGPSGGSAGAQAGESAPAGTGETGTEKDSLGGVGEAGADGAGAGPLAWSAALRGELRWLGAALGAARDADVRALALKAALAALDPEDQDAGAGVLEAARSDQSAAHRKLLEAMESERYLVVLRSLEALGKGPDVPPGPQVAGPTEEDGASGSPLPVPAALWQHLRVQAGPAMAQLGAAQWRSVRRAERRLGDRPSDEALHRLRIQAKRLRYLAEAAGPVVRPAASRRAAEATARAATELQDVLGELHDAIVNEEWLRALATSVANWTANGSSTGPGVALVAGQLLAAMREKASVCRKSWKRQWQRLDRRELMRWAEP